MEKKSVRSGQRHQRLIDPEILERRKSRVVIGIAHRDPGVCEDRVGVADGVLRVMTHTHHSVSGAGQIHKVRMIIGRRGDVQLKTQTTAGVNKARADIVPVADPGQTLSRYRTKMSLDGHEVREDLTRVALFGQTIDDRDGRSVCETFDVIVAIRPDHHGVHHARKHPRGILDRFSATQLHIARIGDDAGSAELTDGGVEGETRARGILFEHHGQHAVLQRRVRVRPAMRPPHTRAFSPMRLIQNGS